MPETSILRTIQTQNRDEGAEKMMGIVREREQNVLHEILDGALQKQKAELAAVSETFKREYLRYYLWMLAGNGAVMLLALVIAAWF